MPAQDQLVRRTYDVSLTTHIPPIQPPVSPLLKDPKEERERVYRWFKRRFIQLTATIPAAGAETITTADTKNGHHPEDASASSPAAKKEARERNKSTDGGTPFISWETARDMLRSGPHRLEDSLAIDLPCLSRDLWTADLVDAEETAGV